MSETPTVPAATAVLTELELLNKARQLAGNQAYDEATIPGFGKVRIQRLSEVDWARQIDMWANNDFGEMDPERRPFFRARVIQCHVVNAQGSVVFQDQENSTEKLELLSRLPKGIVDELYSACVHFSRISTSTAEKNSDAPPSSGG